MENKTFNVGTFFRCDKLLEYEHANALDPLWIQTVVTCNIIDFLRDMYRFNVTYVMQLNDSNTTIINRDGTRFPQFNESIDIYTITKVLRPELLDYSYPVDVISKWRLGFVLRPPVDTNYLQMFYSQPFTRPLWNCLYAMAIIMSIIFFLLQLCEKRLLGRVQENGITYEMLLVMVPPLYAVLSSRRTAYFAFLMFTSIIYSFYTSNLLSHLVNDRSVKMSLESLITSDYQIDVMRNANILAGIGSERHHKNLNKILQEIMDKKLLDGKPVSIINGLQRVKTGKTALLTDYTSLQPYMKKVFTPEEICKLITIDLFSNVKKYFVISKDFAHKEEFKIGVLRIKEVGILKRLVEKYVPIHYTCEPSSHLQTKFMQIFTPLFTMLFSYVLAVLILIGERIYFKRYGVFPYVN